MVQNPPTGVVCSAGVEEACCCLVSLIQLPVTAIGTVKVALRSRTVDPNRSTLAGLAQVSQNASKRPRAVMEPAPEPEQQLDVSGMTVRGIKAELAAQGIDFSGCVERSELEQLLLAASAADGSTGGASVVSAEEAMDEVAARLGVDTLLLPRVTVTIGPHTLSIEQNWLADTTPDNTGSACWPGSLLLAHFLVSPAAGAMLAAAESGL